MTSTDTRRDSERRAGGAEAPRRRPQLPWWVKVPAGLVLLVVVFLIGAALNFFPSFGDLFGEETKDRTGPTLLQSIQDMSRYEAASGNFQVVVDLEKDAKFLPDAIRGTRTLFVGAGTVGAYVDLGQVKGDQVKTNADRTSAELWLPNAELGKPAMDPERSYAVTKERGLLDRFGDFFSDNPADESAVNKLAAKHIGEAAKDSELNKRAEENTTRMLKGLLTSLGFEKVVVHYGQQPPA
ncbi:DUF4230 domain-containing protein [Streptomyces sp. NPDC060194]|uniref:DUF4230 domain-containing protein n=1 Tax=Streptomyces sp. NPDC060194 TaxID=3347069 RepID=UPI00364AF03D